MEDDRRRIRQLKDLPLLAKDAVGASLFALLIINKAPAIVGKMA